MTVTKPRKNSFSKPGPSRSAGRAQRALITGINGFTGPHLARFLLSQGLEVYGIIRAEPSPALRNVADAIRLTKADLMDRDAVFRIVDDVHPEYLFHLASVCHREDLADLLATNVLATDHVLRAASRLAPDVHVKVFIPGSAAEYGMVSPDELPIAEWQPLRPVSLYGISKSAQVSLAYHYCANEGLQTYVGRTFNLIGPGEPLSMLCSALASQIAAAEKHLQDLVVLVGNLTPERDFIDIRDAVQAYWAIINQGRPGEVYNVCSSAPISVESVLDLLLALVDIPIAVQIDAARIRRIDVPRSVGDSRKIRVQTGWEPKVSLTQSLTDVLNYWRDYYRNNGGAHSVGATRAYTHQT